MSQIDTQNNTSSATQPSTQSETPTLDLHRSVSVTAKQNLYMYLSGMLSDYRTCKNHDEKQAEEILVEMKKLLNEAAGEQHLKLIGGA